MIVDSPYHRAEVLEQHATCPNCASVVPVETLQPISIGSLIRHTKRSAARQRKALQAGEVPELTDERGTSPPQGDHSLDVLFDDTTSWVALPPLLRKLRRPLHQLYAPSKLHDKLVHLCEECCAAFVDSSEVRRRKEENAAVRAPRPPGNAASTAAAGRTAVLGGFVARKTERLVDFVFSPLQETLRKNDAELHAKQHLRRSIVTRQQQAVDWGAVPVAPVVAKELRQQEMQRQLQRYGRVSPLRQTDGDPVLGLPAPPAPAAVSGAAGTVSSTGVGATNRGGAVGWGGAAQVVDATTTPALAAEAGAAIPTPPSYARDAHAASEQVDAATRDEAYRALGTDHPLVDIASAAAAGLPSPTVAALAASAAQSREPVLRQPSAFDVSYADRLMFELWDTMCAVCPHAASHPTDIAVECIPPGDPLFVVYRGGRKRLPDPPCRSLLTDADLERRPLFMDIAAADDAPVALMRSQLRAAAGCVGWTLEMPDDERDLLQEVLLDDTLLQSDDEGPEALHPFSESHGDAEGMYSSGSATDSDGIDDDLDDD